MIDEEMFEWTISSLFMIPLIDVPRKKLDKLGFINSYLYNAEEDLVYEHPIHILFKPKKPQDLTAFIELENKKHFKIQDVHDYPGNLVLVTYTLPAKFEDDYKKISEGKYSELSEDFRARIPSHVKYVDSHGLPAVNMSLQHMIMTKYAPLKKYWEDKLGVHFEDSQELWTRPTIESETFKLKNHESVTINAGSD